MWRPSLVPGPNVIAEAGLTAYRLEAVDNPPVVDLVQTELVIVLHIGFLVDERDLDKSGIALDLGPTHHPLHRKPSRLGQPDPGQVVENVFRIVEDSWFLALESIILVGIAHQRRKIQQMCDRGAVITFHGAE